MGHTASRAREGVRQPTAVVLLVSAFSLLVWAGPTEGAEAPEGPVASLIATYMRAFNKHHFMRVAGCFADAYFKDKGMLAADIVTELRRKHPEEGAWHMSLVKLEAQVAQDGQSGKGYFLCRVGGRINETGVDGRRTSRRRRWFYRVDFEARSGADHWRFTKFDQTTSQEARDLYISERVKQIKERMRTRAKTPQEKASLLLDMSFFLYQQDAWAMAADAARRALALDETSSAHSYLAHALKELGKYDEAIAHFRKAASAPDRSAPLSLYRRRIRECKVRKEREMKGK